MSKNATLAKSRLTPIELMFLLHCFYSPEQWDGLQSIAGQEAAARFRKLKVVERVPQIGSVNPDSSSEELYGLTELGHVWLREILSVPMPQKRKLWVDRFGNPITNSEVL
jgi:hypothetical protein